VLAEFHRKGGISLPGAFSSQPDGHTLQTQACSSGLRLVVPGSPSACIVKQQPFCTTALHPSSRVPTERALLSVRHYSRAWYKHYTIPPQSQPTLSRKGCLGSIGSIHLCESSDGPMAGLLSPALSAGGSDVQCAVCRRLTFSFSCLGSRMWGIMASRSCWNTLQTENGDWKNNSENASSWQ